MGLTLEHFVLPGLPISTNRAYRTGSGNYYMTSEGHAWKADATWAIKAQRKTNQDWTGKPLIVTYIWTMRQPMSRDVDGMVKLVQDALADALEIDDAYVCGIIVMRGKGDQDQTEIMVADGSTVEYFAYAVSAISHRKHVSQRKSVARVPVAEADVSGMPTSPLPRGAGQGAGGDGRDGADDVRGARNAQASTVSVAGDGANSD